VASVTNFQKEAGETEVSLLNFVVSDGATLVATRYVSRDDCAAATMYFAEGAPIHRLGQKCIFPDVAALMLGLKGAWRVCQRLELWRFSSSSHALPLGMTANMTAM